ncbi:MAG: hypothetical protein LW724_06955 [Planctomycetaceae bacterium]|jgi:hypothetical protein|nr:hypothetical protein [Planctomycetaceae bacterium]
MLWLIIIGVVAIVGLAIWGDAHYQKKRREAFAKTAQALGVELFFDLSEQDWDAFEQFELYRKRGRSQKVPFALVAETDTTRITVCEYTYVVSHGKSSSKHTVTVLLVRDGRLNIPPFTLSQRTWSASLAKFVGYRFIEFPEDPEFNSLYLIRGDSPEDIREFLTGDRRKQFTSNSVISFEGMGDSFIVIDPGHRLNPSEAESRFAQSLAVLKGML